MRRGRPNARGGRCRRSVGGGKGAGRGGEASGGSCRSRQSSKMSSSESRQSLAQAVRGVTTQCRQAVMSCYLASSTPSVRVHRERDIHFFYTTRLSSFLTHSISTFWGHLFSFPTSAACDSLSFSPLFTRRSTPTVLSFAALASAIPLRVLDISTYQPPY